MRPPEFTGGNVEVTEKVSSSVLACFNEAAGIHRRKLRPDKADRLVLGWLQ